MAKALCELLVGRAEKADLRLHFCIVHDSWNDIKPWLACLGYGWAAGSRKLGHGHHGKGSSGLA